MNASQLGLALLASAVVALGSTEGGLFRKPGRLTFGPNHCASLTRSRSGSCIIRTDCEDEEVEKISFVFDCAGSGGELKRHDFGIGGFDAVEEYDTEVKCLRCELPNLEAPKTHRKSAKTKRVAKISSAERSQVSSFRAERLERLRVVLGKNQKKQASKFESDSPHVKYGPESCVETWRASSGHCMVKTSCKGVDTSDYNFGLLCEEASGTVTRHLFGRRSFEDQETFDTLIECKECLGIEAPEDQAASSGTKGSSPHAKELEKLDADVKNVTKKMQVMQGAIKRLEDKVFKDSKSGAAKSMLISSSRAAHKRVWPNVLFKVGAEEQADAEEQDDEEERADDTEKQQSTRGADERAVEKQGVAKEQADAEEQDDEAEQADDTEQQQSTRGADERAVEKQGMAKDQADAEEQDDEEEQAGDTEEQQSTREAEERGGEEQRAATASEDTAVEEGKETAEVSDAETADSEETAEEGQSTQDAEVVG